MKILYKILIVSFLMVFAISCEKHSTYNFDDKEKQNTENVNNQTDEVSTDAEIIEEADTEGDAGFWDILLVLLVTLGIAGGIAYFFYHFIPIGKWYRAWLSGVKISWGVLIRMRFQKVPHDKMFDILIKAKNAGVIINPRDLAKHYLAHVNIDIVTNTLIRAKNANLTLDLAELARLYLAHVDVEKVLHALVLAKNADVVTNIQELSGYYLANVDIVKVISAKIAARNSGFTIELLELKEHYLSGGDVEKAVEAYIAANKAGLKDFTFEDIAAIDLSNYDVMKAVESAITPIVVETGGVRGVSRDGVELTMKVKVTLRAHIQSIIGGISADTVLARINEGLATEIGMSVSHYDVLQSPFMLADKVHQKDLGERSAYEILSIDVSDIMVGRDIHSGLKIERALADSEQAKAELIMAEEKVKKAMAAAFLDGKLSINEYHEMMNTEADTEMRKKLGESVTKDKEESSHKKGSNKKENDHKKDEHH